jgi:hypothetical protein
VTGLGDLVHRQNEHNQRSLAPLEAIGGIDDYVVQSRLAVEQSLNLLVHRQIRRDDANVFCSYFRRRVLN